MESESAALAFALEAMIDRIVDQKVGAALAARASCGESTATPGRWVTPPRAASETGIPTRTIRAWALEGRVKKRVITKSANPKQAKFKVNVEEVKAVAEARQPSEAGPSLEERARQIRMSKERAGA